MRASHSLETHLNRTKDLGGSMARISMRISLGNLAARRSIFNTEWSRIRVGKEGMNSKKVVVYLRALNLSEIDDFLVGHGCTYIEFFIGDGSAPTDLVV